MRALHFFFMELFHFKFAVFLFILFFSELFLNNCVAVRCLEAENSALLQLKKGFTSGKLESWLPRTNCCIWEGVTCDESGRITGLDLSFRSIAGTINPSLFNLTSLHALHFAGNNFHGIPIPDSGWDRLVNLSRLDLSKAGFAGKVPASISHLTKLTQLDLSYNLNLSMAINPTVWQNMSNLKSLYLDNVNVLTYRDEWCHVLVNSTPALQLLSMHNCSLFGAMCSSLPMKLAFLDFSNNNLDSSIPDSFANFSSLSTLYLQGNNFEGFFPNEIFQLKYLEILDISNNPILAGYLPDFSEDSNLIILFISNTNFSGTLPDSIGNLKFLMYLDLSNNKFHGAIPHGISSKCELIIINLRGNKLEGVLPRSLSNCKLLLILDLANNNLKDTFPYWLGNMPFLSILVLRSNKFYGLVGSPDGSHDTNYTFHTMHLFDISSNNFSGYLPVKCFSSLKSMMINKVDELDAFFNYSAPNINIYEPGFVYKGHLMTLQHYALSKRTIDFSNNHFEGEIPSTFGQLIFLQVLNLSQNYLTGEIPLELGNLVWLESLDLSWNNLSGKIPQEFVLLHSLSYLNLSYNNLVGTIPQSAQLCTFSNTSFERNEGLHWSSCITSVPTTKNTTTSPSSLDGTSLNNKSYMIVLGLLFGVGFGVSMAVVMILDVIFCNKSRWISRRPSHE